MDRFVSIEVDEWMCENKSMDLFLDVYGNCVGSRQNFIVSSILSLFKYIDVL